MKSGKDHTFVERDEEGLGQNGDAALRHPPADPASKAAAAPENQDHHALVIPAPQIAAQPIKTAATRESSSIAAGRPQVHVPENLHELISGIPITPEEAAALKRSRQLNEVIHGMLSVGLVLSTAVMMAGLVLDVILHRDVPIAVPRFEEVFARVVILRPSGFLALGLLLLIATPILRVLGSFFAFVYERDWRYAGITFLVLFILCVSLFFSRG
jgi:uncharacterized membrane protein